MMITTPRGAKVRSESRRRYVVIVEQMIYGDWKGYVAYRTDRLAYARKRANREDGAHVRISIFDQAAREFVPQSVF